MVTISSQTIITAAAVLIEDCGLPEMVPVEYGGTAG